MWCIIVWNLWWKLACNFAKQIPRNRLQQFIFRLSLQNPRWDWARIASATFYFSKSLSIKRRCSLSTDPPIITQKPRVQASPLLHSPPETLSIRGRDIIAAFIQWPSSIEELKKTVKSSPIEVNRLGFNREMHCDATGMYEKEIESAELVFEMNMF